MFAAITYELTGVQWYARVVGVYIAAVTVVCLHTVWGLNEIHYNLNVVEIRISIQKYISQTSLLGAVQIQDLLDVKCTDNQR